MTNQKIIKTTAFPRVNLHPGDTLTVNLTLTIDNDAAYNIAADSIEWAIPVTAYYTKYEDKKEGRFAAWRRKRRETRTCAI